ncbi:crotonase/enoyl-CoA hydratase family protein [Knoellia subterranea]|uniref:Enoyl-CoA hydratase n=1 Tax=Knoellia subterranea KCTC 19937 TaxID=1385521 RepID=A0A0A0JP68_9MICO|nr:crotonase/enoyl-CoA hydratase family protein [Knoellia subterranea]KGN37852.1 enoyl-CoA hydratase [Knoellia subterranea KCTC 19937]
MAELVTTRIEDGIAHVALNRPDKLNALTLDTLEQLIDTAGRLRSDRTLRSVVVSGEGDAFCAGLDFGTVLREPRRVAGAFTPRPWRGTNTFQEACWAWRRLPVPVIAAVHGHCLGGGVQIALAADFRITAPDAKWSVLEARWGIIPDMTGIKALSQQVGMDIAKRLTMTGETVPGTEAVRLGLATEENIDPYAGALALAGRLAERSPDSVAAAKRLFNRTWSASDRRTFMWERLEQARLLMGANAAEARRANTNREKPAYKPRAGINPRG